MGQLDNRPDGVDTYPADQHDLDSYAQAEQALSQLQAPILLHADSPHERLYVAALDGTGNSMFNDAPEHWSVVAQIAHQIQTSKPNNIGIGYVEGTFTQDNPISRYIDGVSGYTFERRVETAYDQLCQQAKDWLREDPDARIRIVGVGFSRGAEECVALLRLVEERGIQDPEGAIYTHYRDGLIKSVEYTRPPLVPPGQTLQAALLYDPVATGVKEHDRRLPPSVMSALQITAEDERRDQFKSTNLLQPGFSEGNRFLNITLGGAHSDIGDTYTFNTLGVRNFNLGIDFINGQSDRAFLDKHAVPGDPALNVVHRSDQHSWIYTERGYRDGVRDRHNHLAPDVLCQRGPVRDCAIKEPIDPALDLQLERRGVPIGPVPAARGQHTPGVDAPESRALHPDAPKSETDLLLDRLYQAALGNDNKAMHEVGRDYLRSPDGRAWQQDVHAYGQAIDARERQGAWEAQAAEQAQQLAVHRPHAMHM